MRKCGKMKTTRLSNKTRKAFQGRSGGFTLIEVLVALALFGIIAITFAGGLATASRAVLIADIRTNAESVARTQMEYVKSQSYIDYSESGHEDYDLITTPEGYDISAFTVDQIEEQLQEITVTVSHDSRVEPVITLVGYKVDR
jgi:prepilin-type N-terminal cleavage/methylation domain-containing protein